MYFLIVSFGRSIIDPALIFLTGVPGFDNGPELSRSWVSFSKPPVLLLCFPIVRHLTINFSLPAALAAFAAMAVDEAD